jgi:hypothetical protein
MNPSKITIKSFYRPSSVHFAYIPKSGCIDKWYGCRDAFHDCESIPDDRDEIKDVKQIAVYLPSPEPDIIFKNVQTILDIVQKKLRKSQCLGLHLIDAFPIGKSNKLKPYAGNQKVMVVDLPKFWRRECQQNLLTALIRAAHYIKQKYIESFKAGIQEINETNFWDALEQSGYFTGHCKKALKKFMAGHTRFKGRNFDGWVYTFYKKNLDKLVKEKN